MSVVWSLLFSYGACAAVFLASAFGVLVLALFGVYFGRYILFMFSILLLVVASFTLAVIAGDDTVGLLAPVLRRVR